MISTTDIENSIVKMIASRFIGADIFRRNATQSREDVQTFVVNVDLQAQTENRDYQRKDVEIIVQYFVNDRLEFNRSYNEVRDLLVSDLFINSIPLENVSGDIVKYLIIKDTDTKIIDDTLSVRLISDFVDDTLRNTDINYDLMGSLHLKKEV